jgi:hypothetical protein
MPARAVVTLTICKVPAGVQIMGLRWRDDVVWQPCVRSNGRRANERTFPLRRAFNPERQSGPKGPRWQKSELSKIGSARSAGSTGATAAATTLHAWTLPKHRLRLHRQQAFPLQFLAGKLPCAANGFGLFTRLFFGRLFVMTAKLHLAENSLALHLLLERLEGLINIVIANENLHAASSSINRI